MRTLFLLLVTAIILFSPAVYAQMPGTNSMSGTMPGMDMASTTSSGANAMTMQSGSFIEFLQSHATSGTDAEPNSTPSEMLMTTYGNWSRRRQTIFDKLDYAHGYQKTRPRIAHPADYAQSRTGNHL